MKKLILLALLIPSIALAGGVMKKDSNKVPFPIIAPTASLALTTGASADGYQTGTLNTTTYSRVSLKPNAAVTVKINGTGTGFPIAQNATWEVAIPSAVTSLVFSNASSATGATVNYLAEE
jgi:hypothetical protein